METHLGDYTHEQEAAKIAAENASQAVLEELHDGGALEGQDDDGTGGVRHERVVVKFLIPTVAAGSIIGKSGTTITEIQMQSGARMQLSKPNEYYPGTMESQDRILLVSGTVDQLLTALHLVLTKLCSEPIAARAVQCRNDTERLQLRMLIHNRLCGTLIGKGGATIKSFNEDSNASFNISPPPTIPGLTERVVRISGDVDELMRAVALVVIKLSENPDYHLLTDANLSYSGRVGLGGAGGYHGNGRYGGGAGYYGGNAPPPSSAGVAPRVPGPHDITVTMAIPEDRVGVVIGKGGAVVNQIKELVQVSIRISRKGEHLPGTQDRACHVTGTQEAVEIAQRLIEQRMHSRA